MYVIEPFVKDEGMSVYSSEGLDCCCCLNNWVSEYVMLLDRAYPPCPSELVIIVFLDLPENTTSWKYAVQYGMGMFRTTSETLRNPALIPRQIELTVSLILCIGAERSIHMPRHARGCQRTTSRVTSLFPVYQLWGSGGRDWKQAVLEDGLGAILPAPHLTIFFLKKIKSVAQTEILMT